MPERLLLMARGFAVLVLVLAVLLLITRWRYPQNQQQSSSVFAFWKEVWRQWRKARSRRKERETNIKAVRGKSVLVIDPDEKSSRVLVWRLESLRCAVTKARNGTQGLSVFRSAEPAVVICDALLPDVSALDFYHALERSDAPVVFVGVLAAQREELTGLGGNIACLGKPFNPDDAVAIAGKMLRQMHKLTLE